MTHKKAPEDRKEEIFEAALKCFNKNGYHKTSIDDIADEIGISKGGIYYHFKSKKNLFMELYKSRVNRYFDKVTTSIHEKLTATEQIRYLLKRSEEVFHDHIDVLRFLLEFVTMGSRDAEIRREVTNTYQNRVETFRRIIQEGIDKGFLKEQDAENASRVLYFLSMGFFLTCFTVDLDFDPVTLHQVNIETLFKGIQKQ